MGVSCDQLAQYRGCEPDNDCYMDCLQAAIETLRDPDDDTKEELEAAEAWAATQRWVGVRDE